jgi:hypothetical protein
MMYGWMAKEVRVNHRPMPDTELIEFVCEERDAVHYLGKK